MLRLINKIFSLMKFNYNIGKKTWFGSGGNAKIFFQPENETELSFFLKVIPKNIKIFILGLGSNILFRDGGFDGVVIKLGNEFEKITLNKNKKELIVWAGAKDINIANFTLKNKIKGFEFLVGIPGSLGGAIKMNASCFERAISDNLLTVEAMDRKGNKFQLNKNELNFRYRTSSIPDNCVLIKATFKIKYGNHEKISELMKKFKLKRKLNQPIGFRTGGSTFMNPGELKAWKLIDKCGFRGKKVGGAEVSKKHCNFLINNGNATSTDIEILGENIRDEIFKKEKIKVDWEIKRIGNFKKI